MPVSEGKLDEGCVMKRSLVRIVQARAWSLETAAPHLLRIVSCHVSWPVFLVTFNVAGLHACCLSLSGCTYPSSTTVASFSLHTLVCFVLPFCVSKVFLQVLFTDLNFRTGWNTAIRVLLRLCVWYDFTSPSAFATKIKVVSERTCLASSLRLHDIETCLTGLVTISPSLSVSFACVQLKNVTFLPVSDTTFLRELPLVIAIDA